MHRLCRAVRLFLGTRLTWCTCLRLGRSDRHYRIVESDGFLYIEPRHAGQYPPKPPPPRYSGILPTQVARTTAWRGAWRRQS